MARLIASRVYSIKAQGNGKVDTRRYAAFPARFLNGREIPDADKLEHLMMVFAAVTFALREACRLPPLTSLSYPSYDLNSKPHS
jgi:hypothetical protein